MSGMNPYGHAFPPLDDSWRDINAPGWNTRPPARPSNAQRPLAPAAIKLTQQTLQIGSEVRSILPERWDRQLLLIQCGAGGTIYVGFSEIPSVATGIEIIVGGSIYLNDPAPANQIYVFCPTATATVRVLEG